MGRDEQYFSYLYVADGMMKYLMVGECVEVRM